MYPPPVVQGTPVQGVPVPTSHALGQVPAPTSAAPQPVAHAGPRPSAVADTSVQEAMAALDKFPPGLVKNLHTSAHEVFPVRFFVVDNSGSMQAGDGNRCLVDAQGRGRMVRATRWEELADTVMQVGTMALALNARTDFHLLNPRPVGQFFTMAHEGASALVATAGQPIDQTVLRRIMSSSPGGTTPLTEAVMQLVSLIEPAAQQLRSRGQQAVVILATDGMPNDPPSFLAALQQLQQLPVWTVVRLCTDEDAVVEYWGNLDAALEAVRRSEAPSRALRSLVGHLELLLHDLPEGQSGVAQQEAPIEALVACTSQCHAMPFFSYSSLATHRDYRGKITT